MNKPAVNVWAVITVVLLLQAIGAVWYSKALFAQEWMRAVGLTAADVKDPTPFFISIVASFISAVVISLIVSFAKINTFMEGVKLGFFLWIGLALPTLAVHYSFAGRSLDLILIDGGHELLSLVLAAGVLSAWKKRCGTSCGCAH
jgi:hypothetical protein